MRVLIADDDAALRHGPGVQVRRWGYVPIACDDGEAAREILTGSAPPPLAIPSEADFSHDVCPPCFELAKKELEL